MKLNADKPHLWKADVERSIDFYNDWFLKFAPATYRAQRKIRTREVREALELTDYLRNISPEFLKENPGVIAMLRMTTAPPIARDRLMGLSRTSRHLIDCLEGKDGKPCRIPPKMSEVPLSEGLSRISEIILELTDRELFPWLDRKERPKREELERAAIVVADRLCGSASDPIIRNAQEQRQLKSLKKWLKAKGYSEVRPDSVKSRGDLAPATFAVRLNIPIHNGEKTTVVPVDCAIQPHTGNRGDLPVLIEAKSAGDSTNTNKRRKEEAQKYSQLKKALGPEVKYILFLCGYFEAGYLGYEASEGIDWIWEHRIGDLELLLGGTQKKTSGAIFEDAAVYDTNLETIEKSRFQQQQTIDQGKSPLDRNKLGQFSTPFILAREIVQSSIQYMNTTGTIKFIEPAVGTGVFFSALLSAARNELISEAIGVELESGYAEVARRLWLDKEFAVIAGDFFDVARQEDNQGRFNLLCTNPPYVRHHHIDPLAKRKLQSEVYGRLGLNASGLSGLYVYFVLLSHDILAENAIASWLIPSEFLYVNYGKVLRDYLLNYVTLLALHQFDPEDVQFDDALVSSCVVTYRKARPAADSRLLYSFGGTLTQPRFEKTIEVGTIDSSEKWHFRSRNNGLTGEERAVRLDQLFDIKRGLATGANSFFILSEDKIRKLEIPQIFLRPILPSPRFLQNNTISADDKGIPIVEKRLFLLDCTEEPEIVQKRYPTLWSYFESGMSQGLAEKYLCASRKVWYFQERREPALFLASYMGRSGDAEQCPLHFYLNLSSALVTNVFLNLYPKPFLRKLLGADETRLIELLKTLQAITCTQVVEEGRSYGGGLHKIEPREMGNVGLPLLPEWLLVECEEQLDLLRT